MKTHTADTLRTAVLTPNHNHNRHLTDLLEMERELDETFAAGEFDREPRHTTDKNFAPCAELSNDEMTQFIIPPPVSTKLTSFEELERQISKTEVDPAYAEYSVRSIY